MSAKGTSSSAAGGSGTGIAPRADERSRFLDLQALAGLAHMRFATRQQIEGAYSGRHRSKQKGGAGEFAEHREYVDGEDLRHLDWKVLARTGRAYVRLFQDETNLLCTLALDTSASMLFRGQDGRGLSKLEYVQYLATALSHVIARQQDQVGLALMADALGAFLSPGAAPGHVARVQDVIAEAKAHPATDLAKGLRDLFSRLPRRGVLVLMSDFLVEDLDALFASVRLFRHRRWEVVVLHIIHPEEERLPEGLAYRFEGLENDGRIDASPEEVRAIYQQRFEAHVASVRQQALSAGCDYRRISTGVPYLEVLGSFLVERSG